MRTTTRLQAGFVLAIILLSLNLLAPLFGSRWVQQTQLAIEHQEHLLVQSEQLLSALKDGETGQRGFILTGREDFLAPLYQGFAEVDRLLLALQQPLQDDSELAPLLAQIKPLVAEQRAYLSAVVDMRRQVGLEATSERIQQGEGKRMMDSIRQLFGDLQSVLNTRMQLLEARRSWQQNLLLGLLVVMAVVDLLLLLLLFHFTFSVLRKGRATRENLRGLSEQLSSGLQRLELRNREISLLGRMTGALQSISSFDECYSIIGRFAAQLFPQNEGSLALYHPSRDVIEEVAHWGVWPPGLEMFEPQACWAVRRGQSHRVADPEKDLLCPHLHGSTVVQQGYTCVPLMAQGEPLGVLTLGGATQVDLELAEAFSEQVSLGVSNLSLRESLRQQSLVDALTGLHNRRFLDETLRRELLRAGRKQLEVAVVLLDVDHFKRFNDTFGHEAGDMVLRHLAVEMKRSVRASDLACRFGGEEFALVMSEISREDAIERCEMLRLSVSRLQVRYGGQPLGPINISLGLAWFPADGDQAEALLQAADTALYQAKRSGRNRLCVYSREMGNAEPQPSA